MRFICFLILVACGSSSAHHKDDAAPPPPPNDATVDASDAAAAAVTPSAEVTPAAGHLSGGTYTMDVVVGPGVSQRPASAGTTSVEANTAIKP